MAPSNERVCNHIPNHVALSILSKLPLKSLKRLSCVQKSWAHLFEDPYFMRLFTSNYYSYSYYNDMCLLLLQLEPNPCGDEYDEQCAVYLLSGERFENRVKVDWPLPFYHVYACGTIGSAINGTFCVYHHYGDQITLWNPITGGHKAIPPSPSKSLFTRAKLQGFGYDHVTNDYKFIQYVYLVPYPIRYLIYRYGNEEAVRRANSISVPHDLPFWEIYSLKSNSWKKLDVDKFVCRDNFGDDYVYTSGVCHWLCIHENDLVSFNLSNEMFLTTPLPLDVTHNSQLAVFNGCVAMTLYHVETTTIHISILGEPGVRESWTKLFIVGPLPPGFYNIIGIGKKGDIFFKNSDNELTRFDLSTQMIEKIKDINVSRSYNKAIHMEIRPSSIEE